MINSHSFKMRPINQYQHDGSFGHPEFEEVMQQVFGDNCTGVDATSGGIIGTRSPVTVRKWKRMI